MLLGVGPEGVENPRWCVRAWAAAAEGSEARQDRERQLRALGIAGAALDRPDPHTGNTALLIAAAENAVGILQSSQILRASNFIQQQRISLVNKRAEVATVEKNLDERIDKGRQRVVRQAIVVVELQKLGVPKTNDIVLKIHLRRFY